jgi:hypothetical protein
MFWFPGLSLMAYSPIVEGYFYDCEIHLSNTSSYNLYMEFEADEELSRDYARFKLFCLEQGDQVVSSYQIHVDAEEDKIYADPNRIYRKIRFYDMDSGKLITELSLGPAAFVAVGGDLETFDAVYALVISDTVLAGGKP